MYCSDLEVIAKYEKATYNQCWSITSSFDGLTKYRNKLISRGKYANEVDELMIKNTKSNRHENYKFWCLLLIFAIKLLIKNLKFYKIRQHILWKAFY